jgi:TolB-like protein/DNA-binding winged helix-turn-helix (wHTH) protein/Tfp pilus assembly protein PilF
MGNRPVYVFGGFELDLGAWRLTRDGKPLPIEPKGLALLALLIERQGDVVTKGEILDELWKDTAVTENAMVRVVAHVRAVLGEDPKEPTCIATVHTRGYRFIAPVSKRTVAVDGPAISPAPPSDAHPERAVPHASRQPPWRAPRSVLAGACVALILAASLYFMTRDRQVSSLPASAPAGAGDLPSIAILPLENLGPAAHQYFADGMTDALTTQLARIEALKVIARGAVMRYRGERPAPSVIARELSVLNVVEGSVLLAGERVRITARLVDGVTDRTLWGESYEGDLRDILDLQGRVARAIVREIRVRMTSEEETRLARSRQVAPSAYQEYLRGLYESEHSLAADVQILATIGEAITRLESAVALEPAWGEAHGALAGAHLRLAGASDNHDERLLHYRTARDVAERALELDPGVVSGRLALARAEFMLEGNWQAAEHQYREVLRLEPNNAAVDHAIFLTYAGRFDEADARQRYSLERWPTSPSVRFWLGANYICAGRFTEAAAEAQEMRLRLGDDGQPQLLEAMVLVGTGQYAAAVELLESRREALMVNRASTFLLRLSHAAARAGDTARARQAFRDFLSLGNPPSPSILFALGDVTGAVEQVETFHRQRDYNLLQARCWPEYENLRKIPAVKKILHAVGISQPD